jgi:UMF1 family MFS transporter
LHPDDFVTALSNALQPGVRRREAASWAMYDFANSGYTTVVITAIYNSYFVASVAGGAPWATLAWTASLACSYALIVLTAPMLGAWMDVRANKKRVLAWTTAGCVLATAALAWTGPGTLGLAVALIIVSNWCYGTGENVGAAFLPEIARPEGLGRVSGWSWAVGYIGGLVVLGVCLAWVLAAQGRGEPATDYVPVTMLITAAAFALTALPVFIWLRERASAQPPSAGGALRAGYARLADTLGHLRRYRDLATLLGAIVAYQAGIQTVIVLAGVYATQALGFGMAESIAMILVVNVTAAIGAAAFGHVQDRLGHTRTLTIVMLLWLATVVVAWRAVEPAMFWVAANLAGLGLGAAQSAGRALVGALAPASRRGEFYGLWGLAVKLASIIGPLTYGLVNWATGGDHRTAMLATGVFFVIGLVILRAVDVQRGIAAAATD